MKKTNIWTKIPVSYTHLLDIVVIAGKGHEMYQEVKGKKNEFNEKKIVIDVYKRQV